MKSIITAEVERLFNRYGADNRSEAGVARIDAIVNACLKDIDKHPELKPAISGRNELGYFVMQTILQTYGETSNVRKFGHINDIVAYLSASRHIRELHERIGEIPSHFGTFHACLTDDLTTVIVTNYYGDSGEDEFYIDFEDNGLTREQILIENGIDEIRWIWGVSDDCIDDIVCDLKSYYEDGQFEGCPSGDDFDLKYDIYAEAVIVPYLKSVSQKI